MSGLPNTCMGELGWLFDEPYCVPEGPVKFGNSIRCVLTHRHRLPDRHIATKRNDASLRPSGKAIAIQSSSGYRIGLSSEDRKHHRIPCLDREETATLRVSLSPLLTTVGDAVHRLAGPGKRTHACVPFLVE